MEVVKSPSLEVVNKWLDWQPVLWLTMGVWSRVGLDLEAHLKYLLNTNIQSMRNKQDKHQALVSSQSYEFFGVSKTWCHTWHAGMEGCRLSRRDGQGRQCGGVALYEKGRFDCTALTVSDDVGERPWFPGSFVVSATSRHSGEISGLVSCSYWRLQLLDIYLWTLYCCDKQIWEMCEVCRK